MRYNVGIVTKREYFMKHRSISFSVGAGMMAACLLLSACTSSDENGPVGKLLGYNNFAYFNTQSIWAFMPEGDEASETEKALWDEMKSIFARVENSVSTDIEGSSVARFNAADAGEEVEIDKTAYEILQTAKEVYEKTEGAYNPAVGLLVDLWGFTPRFTDSDVVADSQPYDREKYWEQLPDGEYIQAFLALTDFSAVTLREEGGKYYAKKPETASIAVDGVTYTMQLNLGGIGKGYAVDQAAALVRASGQEYGYISLGGSSMYVMQNPTIAADENGVRQWKVSINNPRPSEFSVSSYASVSMNDVFLSSSGDYEQYYEIGGKRYCHIINPNTGFPVNADPDSDGSGIAIVSVFGLTAAEGDATTTALMAMGKDRALEYIAENLEDKDVIFVYYDGLADSYTVYTNMEEGKYTVLAEGMSVVKF